MCMWDGWANIFGNAVYFKSFSSYWCCIGPATLLFHHYPFWMTSPEQTQLGKPCRHVSERVVLLTYTINFTLKPPFLITAWAVGTSASIMGQGGATCLSHQSLLSVSQGRRGWLLTDLKQRSGSKVLKFKFHWIDQITWSKEILVNFVENLVYFKKMFNWYSPMNSHIFAIWICGNFT